MSFILGFSFILLLSIFTVLLLIISKRLPKELASSSIFLLIMGDAVLVALWYFSLIELISVEKHFRLGIAAAFCASSMGRSIYFLLNSNKVL